MSDEGVKYAAWSIDGPEAARERLRAVLAVERMVAVTEVTERSTDNVLFPDDPVTYCAEVRAVPIGDAGADDVPSVESGPEVVRSEQIESNSTTPDVNPMPRFRLWGKR